jgi:hypothetical protein
MQEILCVFLPLWENLKNVINFLTHGIDIRMGENAKNHGLGSVAGVGKGR